MAKDRVTYICGECGYESAKWMGKCPQCESWNTMTESAVVQVKSSAPSGSAVSQKLSKVAPLPQKARVRRNWRVGSRAWRGNHPRHGRAAWRRPGHREIDAAAAGGGYARDGRRCALCVRRGERVPDQAARRSPRHEKRHRRTLRNRSRPDHRRGDEHALQRTDRRLDSDDSLRGERGFARQRQPGARRDVAAHAVCERRPAWSCSSSAT